MVLILAVVVFGLLVPIPFHGRIATATGDLAHAPLFGGLALITLVFWQRLQPVHSLGMKLAIRLGAVVIVLATFGLGMEYVQRHMGRSAAWHDAIANALGILAATFFWFAFWMRRHRIGSRILHRAFWLSAGALFAIAWWSPVMMLIDVGRVHWDFPLLASFETPQELRRWYPHKGTSIRRVADTPTHNFHCVEVLYGREGFPGFTMFEMHRDWSSMKSLHVDVCLDAESSVEEVEFMIQLIDITQSGRDGEKFHQSWKIKRGEWTALEISRADIDAVTGEAATDLTQMRFVDLGIVDAPPGTKVRIDHLRVQQ